MTVRYHAVAESYKLTADEFTDHVLSMSQVEGDLEFYLMNLGGEALQYEIDICPGEDQNGDKIWIVDTALTSLAANTSINLTVTERWAHHVRFRLNDGSVQADGDVTINGPTAGDTVTVNGLTYTAVNGGKTDNTEFSVDGTNNQIAIDLADSIHFDNRDPVTVPTIDVDASASGPTVTITADEAGTDGNSIDLSSSNGTTLSVSGATLTGGTSTGSFTLYNLFGTFINSRG